MIIFRWTSQWLSNGCIVVQPNFDRLDIDVVDHRGLLVNSRGIKFSRSVLLLPWSHRPKGPRRGRPPNNYHSLETDPASVFFFIGCPDISCFLYVLLLSNKDAHPQPELHSTSFQGGGGVVKAQLIILQFLCRTFKFVYSSLSSYEKNDQRLGPGEFSKVRGVPWRDNTPILYIPRWPPMEFATI